METLTIEKELSMEDIEDALIEVEESLDTVFSSTCGDGNRCQCNNCSCGNGHRC